MVSVRAIADPTRRQIIELLCAVATVGEAWTQPQHIVRWWAPGGMDVKVVHHDFRPGKFCERAIAIRMPRSQQPSAS